MQKCSAEVSEFPTRTRSLTNIGYACKKEANDCQTRRQYAAHWLHSEISTLVINVDTCLTHTRRAAIKKAMKMT